MPVTNSIYVVFLPLEMQRKLKQTKEYHMFFQFVWKETTHKPLKVVASKNIFCSMYIIGRTCFDECFLFHVRNGRHYFS